METSLLIIRGYKNRNTLGPLVLFHAQNFEILLQREVCMLKTVVLSIFKDMYRLFVFTCFLCISSLMAQDQRGFEVKAYGGGFSENLVGDSGKRKVALVVGVSNYSSESLKLKYASNDAGLFRDYLVEVRKFPNPNIFFLPDSAATAGKIYNLIRSMMQAPTAGDELVLYFAGHGDVQTVDDFSEAVPEAFVLCLDVGAVSRSAGDANIIRAAARQRDVRRGAAAERHGLLVVRDDAALDGWIDQAIAANPQPAADVRAGKMAAVGRLVGAVMKLAGGKADAKTVNERIVAKLQGGA